jgi:hypothetical protein
LQVQFIILKSKLEPEKSCTPVVIGWVVPFYDKPLIDRLFAQLIGDPKIVAIDAGISTAQNPEGLMPYSDH